VNALSSAGSLWAPRQQASGPRARGEGRKRNVRGMDVQTCLVPDQIGLAGMRAPSGTGKRRRRWRGCSLGHHPGGNASHQLTYQSPDELLSLRLSHPDWLILRSAVDGFQASSGARRRERRMGAARRSAPELWDDRARLLDAARGRAPRGQPARKEVRPGLHCENWRGSANRSRAYSGSLGVRGRTDGRLDFMWERFDQRQSFVKSWGLS